MDSLAPSIFRLSAHDIANGGGFAEIILKSGAKFNGEINLTLGDDVLHLNAYKFSEYQGWYKTGGWHTIDYNEIAAISGEPWKNIT